MASFYYKPDSDTRSAFEFASDNFNFCVSSMATDYLNTLFSGLFGILKTQMGAADLMTSVMKDLRSQLNTIYAPFSSMMDKFWNKFKQIGSLSSRIFQHLYMSMKKTAATALASMFVALSLQTALLNGIDLVINIIMIVLYILIALAFIFFIPILPVMVIVFMAVNGIESGFPGRTGSMGEVFCFAPGTSVYMNNFTTKNIEEVLLGDTLLNGQKVEAVVELPGLLQPLYTIDGIHVSGDHLIWSTETNKMIPVKEHPDSKVSKVMTHTVWTLITSNREIPVRGNTKLLQFSDWEEQPDTYEDALHWEIAVRDILKSQTFKIMTVPKNAPCFDRSIRVKRFQGGWVPLHEIKRGEWIMGDSRWTQILGICHREVKGGIGEKGYRITDGVWLKNAEGKWDHLHAVADTWTWQGMNLITDCGSFRIRLENTEYSVRDFTEVGMINLHETYARVEKVKLESLQKR
jgi:hypothetical protein